jgi:hypothetical protein
MRADINEDLDTLYGPMRKPATSIKHDQDKPRKRIYGLTMYLIDSPVPVFLDNVEHIQTEGGLLRLIIDGKSKWWPLCNVSVIVENSVRTL